MHFELNSKGLGVVIGHPSEGPLRQVALGIAWAPRISVNFMIADPLAQNDFGYRGLVIYAAVRRDDAKWNYSRVDTRGVYLSNPPERNMT